MMDGEESGLIRELTCPITQEIFKMPVTASDGHTYERDAVLRWFGTGKKRSPVTNELLDNVELRPNLCVQKLVESYKTQQGVKLRTCVERDDLSAALALIETSNLDVKNDKGETPLVVLLSKQPIQARHIDFLLTLLDNGASVNVSNGQGLSALALAHNSGLPTHVLDRLHQSLEREKKQASVKLEEQQRMRENYRSQQRERQQLLNAQNEALNGLQIGPERTIQVSTDVTGLFPSLAGLLFLNLPAPPQQTESHVLPHDQNGERALENDVERGGASQRRGDSVPVVIQRSWSAASDLLFGPIRVPAGEVAQHIALANATLALCSFAVMVVFIL